MVVESADQIEAAAAVVLPGVGSFASGMAMLREHGLVEPLRDRIIAHRPTLAVCLGHQLLFEGSEEAPGVEGLGVAGGIVRRFPSSVRVPQLGWNRVEPSASCALLRRGEAYFANSFRAESPPEGFVVAMSEHGGAFVAAMEAGPVLTCQFHPELSGTWGQRLLQDWVGRARAHAEQTGAISPGERAAC